MQDVHWPQAGCCPATAETAAKSIESDSLMFGGGNICASVEEGLGCTKRFGEPTNRSERGKLNFYIYKLSLRYSASSCLGILRSSLQDSEAVRPPIIVRTSGGGSPCGLRLVRLDTREH